MKRSFLFFFFCAFLLSAGAQNYIKRVDFPENSSLDQKVEMAARLVPTAGQLDWQKLELTAFLHFGINTFTGREWGDGSEDPTLFNPTDFDAEQWVLALKAAGFKMALLTAKHHDGFCLWPTQTTKHSVASSPWKGGKGDVVRELKEACDKHGMKFGVYLSPWDRNAACYGDSPAYNRFFNEQLTELLSNYGDIYEVWFDGANGEGPNGKVQIYDWDTTLETIHRLQPRAVTAIMGDDVRWVGNERGLGRTTEWSATVLSPEIYADGPHENQRMKLQAQSPDLGGRKMLTDARSLYWYPSEVDVSIRPGWFYHPEQDKEVKSLAKLVDIYFQSVGYNSVLLLNIPPDTRGRINEVDAARIKELATYVEQTFTDNRIVKSKAWNGKQGKSKKFALKPNSRINTLMLQENISKGQRVEAFTVEALSDEGWKQVANGTTIGYKRLVRFPEGTFSKLRVNLLQSRGKTFLLPVGAYYAQPLSDEAVALTLNDLPRETWKVTATQPLTVDLGSETTFTTFTYAPTAGGEKALYRYALSVSADGTNWTVVAKGEFSNIMHNPIPQTVKLKEKQTARYFKLEGVNEADQTPVVTTNEVGILLN